MEVYKVQEEDLIADLKGFPIEVAQAMVDYQTEQGNESDIGIFQFNKGATKCRGGFEWSETEEHKENDRFWMFVIYGKGFHRYFNYHNNKRQSQ